MFFKSIATLALFSSVAKAQPGGGDTSCSGQGHHYDTPSTGACISTWSNGGTYSYPADFEGILNEVTVYVCPSSGKRVIISNGIPDHEVVQGNPKSPCEKKWAVSIPLNPTIASSKSEVPTRNIIAMAINGVPAYGPQEAGSTNAVEPDAGATITDAQFWYGHAAFNNDWHLHNPHMGQENPSENDLLGYALDGFPIFGPLADASVLDACNGQTVNGQYQYHVRELDQVDSSLEYCNGDSPEVNWNYILGCYSGTLDDTEVSDSDDFILPSDCVEEETGPELCANEGFLGRTFYIPVDSKCVKIEFFEGGTISLDATGSLCTVDEFTASMTLSEFDYASGSSAFFTPSGGSSWSGEIEFQKDDNVSDVELEQINIGNKVFEYVMKSPDCDLGAPYPCLSDSFEGGVIYVPGFGRCHKLQLFDGGFITADNSDPNCSSTVPDFSTVISEVSSIHGNEVYFDPVGNNGWSGKVQLFEDSSVSNLTVNPTVDTTSKEFSLYITESNCANFLL